MLHGGEAGESDAAECDRPLFNRQDRELVCPAVYAERARSPVPTKKNILGVPCQVHEKVVESRESAKMKHRQDATVAPRRAWNPRNGHPYADHAGDVVGKPHAYKGPIAPAERSHHDARCRAKSKSRQIDLRLGQKSHLSGN